MPSAAKIAARAFRNGRFHPTVAGPVHCRPGRSRTAVPGSVIGSHARVRGGDRNVEIATLIAAVIAGVTGLVNTVAIILVNGKVDRLNGRVDVLQDAVMKPRP